MPSRKLSDLDPRFRPIAELILATCKARGVELLVTCTLRTRGEQAGLYAQGRTKPGMRVTNAKPGQSAHNYGLAMDVVPIIAGKAVWNAKHPHWRVYGEVVQECGAVWGGTFRSVRDLPHCEAPNWRAIIGSA